jgi:hypothetical protein
MRLFPQGEPPVGPLQFELAPLARRTVDLNAVLGGHSVSTLIQSDQPVAATRQMTWRDPVYGSTLESGISRTSRTWYFAEGATNVFSLFYLLENPGETPANMMLTHLVEGSSAPTLQPVVLPPFTRLTILVNDVPGLSRAALSTIVTSDVPIVAERAMYLNSTDRVWEAGAASGGAIAPATSWSFAEGATGFFHTYLLLGNPAASEATVTVSYQFPNATMLTKTYVVPPQSRRTVDVNLDDPQLTATAVAMSVTSTVPIVAERSMWWEGYPWTEGSTVIGATATGALWGIGEGAEGGSLQASTFVLVANASAAEGTVQFTVVYDDGTREQKDYTLLAHARLTVRMGDPDSFPNTSGKRFSVLVESLTAGVPITVEYARYQWAASFLDSGGAALANRIR